ncbi:MAG: zf-HC2 domain-containing protein, partial [Chthoniobacterales bacterium]
MPTIHDDIEPWLAASVHDQLSAEERNALQEHLANCETCRALYAEELATHNMISTILDEVKPDITFEQRVLSGFRQKLPHRAGVFSVFANLLRSRAAQVVAVAAVLLTMVEVGRLVTGEHAESLGGFLTPVEGLRQLPSFARQASTENESNGGDESGIAEGVTRDAERVVVTGSHVPTAETESSLPVTVYNATAVGKQAANAAPPPPASAAARGGSGRLMGIPRPDARKVAAAPEEMKSHGSDPSAGGPGDEKPSKAANPDANRKLVRNAQVELEVIGFDDAVQKITALVTEMRGYVATS